MSVLSTSTVTVIVMQTVLILRGATAASASQGSPEMDSAVEVNHREKHY